MKCERFGGIIKPSVYTLPMTNSIPKKFFSSLPNFEIKAVGVGSVLTSDGSILTSLYRIGESGVNRDARKLGHLDQWIFNSKKNS